MWSHDFFEKTLRTNGCSVIAGVDEVGRGALAGPVVAAAIVLSGDGDYDDIQDSKALTAASRERLAARLRKEALAFAFGLVDEKEIDRINILQATHKAMRQALSNLSVVPDAILVCSFSNMVGDGSAATNISGRVDSRSEEKLPEPAPISATRFPTYGENTSRIHRW